jgi:hypothetical protein
MLPGLTIGMSMDRWTPGLTTVTLRLAGSFGLWNIRTFREAPVEPKSPEGICTGHLARLLTIGGKRAAAIGLLLVSVGQIQLLGKGA